MSTRLPDRSERLLMQLVADKLSVRWYVGYNLDEPLPDHSSLTRIRERYGVKVCWLLVVSVGQNWLVRTPHAVSCFLPIHQKESTISNINSLIFTKG
jgi:Transposase domain (DUF772)